MSSKLCIHSKSTAFQIHGLNGDKGISHGMTYIASAAGLTVLRCSFRRCQRDTRKTRSFEQRESALLASALVHLVDVVRVDFP